MVLQGEGLLVRGRCSGRRSWSRSHPAASSQHCTGRTASVGRKSTRASACRHMCLQLQVDRSPRDVIQMTQPHLLVVKQLALSRAQGSAPDGDRVQRPQVASQKLPCVIQPVPHWHQSFCCWQL